jgi:hypothetical protein
MLKLALSLKRGLILYHLHQLWCEKNMLTSFGSHEHTLISPGISISHVATSRERPLLPPFPTTYFTACILAQQPTLYLHFFFFCIIVLWFFITFYFVQFFAMTIKYKETICEIFFLYWVLVFSIQLYSMQVNKWNQLIITILIFCKVN